MKKITLSLVVLCAFLVVACGNSAMSEIAKLVVDATEQTKAATSAEEVAAIAFNLEAEMNRIEAESGEKIAFGASVDAALVKYQEAAEAKLAEFGLEF